MSAPAGRHVIVNFHGVGTPHEDVPDDEKPYWVSERLFTGTVDRIAELRAQGHDIRITFDDGNRSDIDIAARVLSERQMRADFFVLTGRIGWERYLTPYDIRMLVEMGMGVGLHGRDHVDWRRLDPSDLEAETVAARAALAQVAGGPVTMVSVPFGAYDRPVIAHLKRLRYVEIHTSDGGTAADGALILPRTSIRSDMSAERIEAILTAREGPVPRLRRALSMFLRQRVVGGGLARAPGMVRSLWKRLMLRNTAFTGSYGKLKKLYSLEDPWDMASEREQHRFVRTNELLAQIAECYDTVLELGCGEGHQTRHLRALAGRLYGIELSERAVERARARCPDATLFAGGLEDVPELLPDVRFDLLVACEVLYYVRELDGILPALQARTRRLFVSNYLPRSEVIRHHFQGDGWRQLDTLTHGETVWECFLWESPDSRS